SNLREAVKSNENIEVVVKKSNGEEWKFLTKHSMSGRQINTLLQGGIINHFKQELSNREVGADKKNTVTGDPRKEGDSLYS
ncbi:MAG TPA: hypothetical protein VFM82_04035, partial [Flavobacteriaceae bacterium]|nr:hypothetical protein [Flavobacteriaceae bacterium]